MKTLLLVAAVILAGLLGYFLGFKPKESILKTDDKQTSKTSIIASPTPSVQPTFSSDADETTKELDHKETVKAGINSGAPATEESKPGYKRLYVILSQELSGQGFPAGVNECLERVADNNLKREKPLSIDGMAEVCVTESGLVDGDKVKLAAAFRKSVSASQKPVDIKVWHACSSNKMLENVSQCFKDVYKRTVEEFYSKTMSEAETLPGSDFQTRWNTDVRAAIDKILKYCPASDTESINKVYAYEC